MTKEAYLVTPDKRDVVVTLENNALHVSMARAVASTKELVAILPFRPVAEVGIASWLRAAFRAASLVALSMELPCVERAATLGDLPRAVHNVCVLLFSDVCPVHSAVSPRLLGNELGVPWGMAQQHLDDIWRDAQSPVVRVSVDDDGTLLYLHESLIA